MKQVLLVVAVIDLLLFLSYQWPALWAEMVEILIERGRTRDEARIELGWSSIKSWLTAVICCAWVLL